MNDILEFYLYENNGNENWPLFKNKREIYSIFRYNIIKIHFRITLDLFIVFFSYFYLHQSKSLNKQSNPRTVGEAMLYTRINKAAKPVEYWINVIQIRIIFG